MKFFLNGAFVVKTSTGKEFQACLVLGSKDFLIPVRRPSEIKLIIIGSKVATQFIKQPRKQIGPMVKGLVASKLAMFRWNHIILVP